MGRRTRLFLVSLLSLGAGFGAISVPGTASAQVPAATVAVARTSPSTPASWTVRPGDTLSAIAFPMGQSWEVLASVNHLANPNLIYPGQVIYAAPAGYSAHAASMPSIAPSSAPRVVTSVTEAASTVPRTPSPAPSSPSTSGVWACIAHYESGGNPATNTGNGYYGMYQDTLGTWAAAGGLRYASRPDLATAAEQTAVNMVAQQQQGWGAWPVTSRKCGV